MVLDWWTYSFVSWSHLGGFSCPICRSGFELFHNIDSSMAQEREESEVDFRWYHYERATSGVPS